MKTTDGRNDEIQNKQGVETDAKDRAQARNTALVTKMPPH